MKRGKIVNFYLKLLLGTLCVLHIFSFVRSFAARSLAQIRLFVLFAVMPLDKKWAKDANDLTETYRSSNGKLFFAKTILIFVTFVRQFSQSVPFEMSCREKCMQCCSICNRTKANRGRGTSTTPPIYHHQSLWNIYILIHTTANDGQHKTRSIAHIYQTSNTKNHAIFLFIIFVFSYSVCAKLDKSFNHHRAAAKWELNRTRRNEKRRENNWIISQRTFWVVCAIIDSKLCTTIFSQFNGPMRFTQHIEICYLANRIED